MSEFFTVSNLLTLGMLVLLETVLGFDNLLYLSIESKRAPAEKQALARRVGLTLAVVTRVLLLFVLLRAMSYFQKPIVSLPPEGPLGWAVAGAATVEALILLVGGVLLVHTAIKEIWRMLDAPDGEGHGKRPPASVPSVVASMLAMNLVFSFDSVLSAVALTKNFWTMATAIVLSGLLMVRLADRFAAFLSRNRMYEVLGLFVLLLIGVLLLGEGGHLAHLTLFGHAVEPMAKSTFYFTIAVLVAVDVVQGRYQKKVAAEQPAT